VLTNYFLEGTPQVMACTRKRILIVDDDPGMLSVLEYRLGKAGYDIITAEDGAQALESARTEVPDLIFLDLLMTRLNGFGFLEQLKSDTALKTVPVIVITAYALEEHRRRSLELGAADYFEKPFSLRDLVAEVDRILAPNEGTDCGVAA
jgi:DNA-binding response OmpR family regulator